MQSKTIILIACAALLLAACTSQPAKKTLIDTIPNTPSELIYNDVLSESFTSMNVTVLGVGLGMSENSVLQKLGPADNDEQYDFGAIKNWAYAEKLGFTQTAVMYHFEKGILTRIIIGPAFNHFLSGTSMVGKNKSVIYGAFGLPQRQYDIKTGRFFVYNNLGLEVYLDTHDVETQYAFVYPMRKLPSLATTNATVDPLNPVMPALITDTTTLCNQGPTFGQNPVTQECKPFTNSCTIPDSWVEVKSCANTTASTTNLTIPTNSS